jgi:hypothetical protein
MATLLGPQPAVEVLGLPHRRRFGTAPVGVVTANRPVGAPRRGDVGEDPVVGAVGREVVDVGEDLLTGGDRVPHQAEDRSRHVRVANDAVRLADELGLAISRDPDEDAVRVADPALRVGLGDDDLLRAEGSFDAGGSHMCWSHPDEPFAADIVTCPAGQTSTG